MLSGRRLDLLDPSPLDIEIEDIAHGLSRMARWNGQTAGEWAFSVAQHSLLVEELMRVYRPATRRDWLLSGLLHDAPEYVIGDIISPFKTALGTDYKAFEMKLMEAIFQAFNLPSLPSKELWDLIKRADAAAAYFEATQLAGFTSEEAVPFFGMPLFPRPHTVKLTCLRPEAAKAAFLTRFFTLW